MITFYLDLKLEVKVLFDILPDGLCDFNDSVKNIFNRGGEKDKNVSPKKICIVSNKF